MIQVFPRWFDSVARAGIAMTVLAVPATAVGIGILYRSDYFVGRHVAYEQPAPFSHKHHVGQLGIDCRYCHTGVETSAFAGLPPTETCINCHEQIWVGAPMLEPIRESWKTNTPLHWRRVHSLPQFVYFNHSIHVAKGVGCAECHGRVDEMPLMWQEMPLTMGWCVQCHRNPAPRLRPQVEVFNVDWQRGPDTPPPEDLKRELGVKDPYQLTSCSTCHR